MSVCSSRGPRVQLTRSNDKADKGAEAVVADEGAVVVNAEIEAAAVRAGASNSEEVLSAVRSRFESQLLRSLHSAYQGVGFWLGLLSNQQASTSLAVLVTKQGISFKGRSKAPFQTLTFQRSSNPIEEGDQYSFSGDCASTQISESASKSCITVSDLALLHPRLSSSIEHVTYPSTWMASRTVD